MRRPLAEVSANIVPFDPTADYVLDTPAPKRPRLKTLEDVAPLTPTTLLTNALSLPPQIPPPSNGPRRSSRVSAIPKVDYFNVLADIDGKSESSPGDVDPEDSSDEDLMSIIDTDEIFNDLEEFEVEDGGPSTATAAPSGSPKYKHFADENGRIRIGPQPMAPLVHVKWAPRREAIKRIMRFTRQNFLAIDRKIRTSAPVDHDSDLAAV